MRARKRFPTVIVAGAAAGVMAALAYTSAGAQSTVPSGPNRLKYPEGWEKWVLYATVDRPDTKQYREFYASSQAVVDAAKQGKPLPNGTVLTLAAYAAKVDDKGVPLRDSYGRFIKDKLVAVNIMAKGEGFGAEVPADIRNGDWLYQSFTPDGKVNDKANLTACFQCHLPYAKDDYLTNMAKLAGRFPATAVATPRSGPLDVLISGFAFGPGTVKVAAGQAITWTNVDDTPHQVTITGPKGVRSDVMLKGQAATLKFDEAGNFAYICGLHPTMKGTIEVAPK
jgi:plastocyanin